MTKLKGIRSNKIRGEDARDMGGQHTILQDFQQGQCVK